MLKRALITMAAVLLLTAGNPLTAADEPDATISIDETQVMALDLAGIAVSSGAACSSGKVGPSHVLCAMGADVESARSAIRISLGAASRPADIDRFLEAWLTLMERTASQPGRAIA